MKYNSKYHIVTESAKKDGDGFVGKTYCGIKVNEFDRAIDQATAIKGERWECKYLCKKCSNSIGV